MLEEDKNQKTVEAYDKNPQFYAGKFDSYGVRTGDVDRALVLNTSGCKKVLELGCGNGKEAEYIVSLVGKDNYTGLDASEGLIQIAREKVPQGTFHVKDIRMINLPAGEYGVIFSFASVLHLKRDELETLVTKCLKSLKTWGILYITSRYGDYRERKLKNLGDEKFYYHYKPADLKIIAGEDCEVVSERIYEDKNYGPSFTLALRKI